jgi:hypothetical protein
VDALVASRDALSAADGFNSPSRSPASPPSSTMTYAIVFLGFGSNLIVQCLTGFQGVSDTVLTQSGVLLSRTLIDEHRVIRSLHWRGVWNRSASGAAGDPLVDPLKPRVKRVCHAADTHPIQVDESVVETDFPSARRPPVESDRTSVEDAAVHQAVVQIHVGIPPYYLECPPRV